MLYDWTQRDVLARGVVERAIVGGSFCVHEVIGRRKVKLSRECPTYTAAVGLILDMLTSSRYGVIKDLREITAVGHRVVHGGEKFAKSVLITPAVLEVFKSLSALAPLHNPPNISGIEAAQEMLPSASHVAVMDTAWHQTLLPPQYVYAVPYEWYEEYGVRRYGFHGTSLLYVAKRAAVLLGKDPFACNIISLHVGNGVSANAVKNGISFDTSMGFTPLEGLVMGTRPGDHDPSLDFYMMRKQGLAIEEIESILNKKSGFLGLTKRYSDRRDIFTAADMGDSQAKLAIEIEVYRLKKYIGAYTAGLDRVDALVWTAGAGEMAAVLRERVMNGLAHLGILMDAEKNSLAQSRNAEFDITAPGSAVRIFVIPTDEEQVLTEDAVAIIEERYDVHDRFQYSFSSTEYRNHLRDAEFKRELKQNPEMRKALAIPLPAVDNTSRDREGTHSFKKRKTK
jgi:acetate kinase